MSDNPFQAPISQPEKYQPNGQQAIGIGYVKQIPVIASLMIAQGVLLLLLAVVMVGYAFVFTRMDTFMPDNAQQSPQLKEMMEVQKKILPIVFGVISAGATILGVLHFVAAYFGFNYKHRVFGIAVMILGLGTILTVYCAPTSIGLAVYGLIIYFNPAVVKAFQLAKQGVEKQDILAQFQK